MTALAVILAVILDKAFAEPRRHHPLVYFGAWAQWLQVRLNKHKRRRIRGVIAVAAAVLPLVLAALLLEYYLAGYRVLELLVSALILYMAIGWQSLLLHARDVAAPLAQGNIRAARQALGNIVSRDVSGLDERGVVKAATESVLENGADAIFSALFWFVLCGIPGVVAYRLCNTLDAMWGYKSERFFAFGWCAARLDDVLNYVPARLTALSYALVGNFSTAIHCWQSQAGRWDSPNAGPVMAAGAGALGVSLGGPAVYRGEHKSRPVLGPSESVADGARAETIERACQLISRALGLWLLLLVILELLL